MGKHQHSKDKLYVVASEYQRDWGGCKRREKSLPFRCLPFDCCGLSLVPFKEPVCTKHGVAFDAEQIVKYIKKHGRNPIDGSPLTVEELIPLRFYTNSEGQYHCPITFKVFNNHSHIVANGKSGNVYAFEAIDELCRKSKHWQDLLSGEPFRASDLITIQNPMNVSARKIEEFDYIQRGGEPGVVGAFEEGADVPQIQAEGMLQRVLDKVRHTTKDKNDRLAEGSITSSSVPPTEAPVTSADGLHRSDAPPASTESSLHPLYTTYEAAASFTSTIISKPSTGAVVKTQFRPLTLAEKRGPIYAEVKKRKLKGYVRLVTSLGAINVELAACWAPLASHNFIRHCKSGYYDGTIFHRCIPNFMVQGGDPTGSGKGGRSSFEDGKSFEDEFYPKLTHNGAGVVAMANAGKNTNRSQFYITFKSCEHLNNKHTVFGQVVGGFDVLKRMEELETNEKNDRPLQPPKIESVIVYKDPFAEVEESFAKTEEQQSQVQPGRELPVVGTNLSQESNSVGKYIQTVKNTKKRRI